MALYNTSHPTITTFHVEEGYLSMFTEASMIAQTRSAVQPVGTYLFYNGLQLSVTHNEHQAEQGWGQVYANLRAPKSISTDLAVSALYTQEADPSWSAAGHSLLRIYIDYIDPTVGVARTADTLNSIHDLTQTIVIKDCVCTSRKLAASDDQSVVYSLQFTGGESIFLANTEMDLL